MNQVNAFKLGGTKIASVNSGAKIFRFFVGIGTKIGVRVAAQLALIVVVALLANRAFGGAFNDAAVNGTYAFSGSVTLNDPTKLCGGGVSCGGANNVNGSLSQFTQTLVNDMRAGKCSSVSPHLLSALNAAKTAKIQPGDRIDFAGTLVADGMGNIIGGFLAANSNDPTSESLNWTNSAADAVLCGGASQDGDCSSLCTSASLGCNSQGGYSVGITGTGTEAIYAYPIAGSLCGGRPTMTFAECCNDPNLVVVLHEAFTLSSGASHMRSIFTDQQWTGCSDAELQ